MTNTQTAKVATHTVKTCKITLGLLSIDAKLLSAAREEGTGLKMVVKTEDGKIVPASQIYTANGKYYNFQDVGRAIEQGDGSFLWIEKAEIDACKASDDKEVEITEFFPMSEVDPIFFDSGYFIAPDQSQLPVVCRLCHSPVGHEGSRFGGKGEAHHEGQRAQRHHPCLQRWHAGRSNASHHLHFG